MTVRRNRIPSVAARLEETVSEALDGAALLVVQSAKARVPVDRGTLRDSIHVEKVATGGRYSDRRIVAGNSKAWYGHIVEHGGVKHPPRPFLIPAYETNRAAILQRIEDALERLTGSS